MTAPGAQQLLAKADDLAVFHAAALRAREIAGKQQTSAADLERALSLDPILTGRVLKIANSPYYGTRHVASLREAVVRIGFQTTRDLATALALGQMSELPAVRHHKMWAHSVRVGLLARRIAKWCRQPADALFIAGLMHDLGSLVMLLCEPQSYEELLGKGSHSPGFTRLERARYGCDHAELGGLCIARWNFDPVVIRAVRDHHAADASPEALVVSLADQMASLHQAGAPTPMILAISAGLDATKQLNVGSRIPAILDDFDADVADFEQWGGGRLVA